MATDRHQLRAPSTEALDRGYETSTISVKGLAIFLVCLVLVAAIVHAGMWYLLRGYVGTDALRDRATSALSDERVTPRYRLPGPPPPLIQPTYPGGNVPEADLRLMYSEEDIVFRRMGWVIDERTHVPVQIPSRVIEAVVRDEAQRQQQVGAATQPAFGPQPGAAVPQSSQPGAAVPQRSQPGAAVPQRSQPGATVPQSLQPGATVPRTPGAGQS